MAERLTRLGFVTYAGAPDLTGDDRLAVEPLRRLGYAVEPLVWDDPSVSWERYPALVLRSTWDYHKKTTAFASWISQVESLGCRLWNPPGLVRWNMDKSYLRELTDRGVPVTPTEWLQRGERSDLAALFARTGWARAVVKPTLSATAFRTWVSSPASAAGDQARLDDMGRDGGVLIQQFEESIGAGEWSLVYFAGEFSHAVLKVPAAGDFRVQKEYGGTSAPAAAPERARVVAELALERVRFGWLYARVDLVDSPTGVRLMELEMLEPDLFLRHNAGAPERFARSIGSRMRQGEAASDRV